MRHLGHALQGDFDLAELDAKAPDLDLVVQPTEVVQDPVGALPDQIAGPVQATAELWVLHKPLRGQLGATQVAVGEPIPTDVELALLAGGERRAVLGDDVDVCVGDRQPDRNRRLAALEPHARRPDRSLGRPEHVPELAAALQQYGGEGGRQRLAAAERPQARPAGPAGVDQKPPGGGRGLHDRGVARFEQGGERRPVTRGGASRQDHATARDERQEQLEPEDVERRGRHRDERVPRVEARDLAHARKEVAERAMGDHHALRSARRAGRVDHIGEILPTRLDRSQIRNPPPRLVQRVQANHGLSSVWKGGGRLRVGEQDRGSGVFEHQRDPPERIGRVHRHICRPRAQHPEQTHGEVQRAVEADRDQGPTPHSVAQQPRSQQSAPLLELRKGQPLAPLDLHRHGAGTAADGLQEEAVQGPGARVRFSAQGRIHGCFQIHQTVWLQRSGSRHSSALVVGLPSPKMRSSLNLEGKARTRPPAASAGPSRRDRSRPAPLSFSQLRLWFLQQWEPEAPTFNAVRALRLHGALDVDALQRALGTLVERHEALRTVFRAARGGEPYQLVLDPPGLDLPLVDLSAHPPHERDEHLQRQLRELSRQPFDLTTDLMLRTTLFRLGEQEHVLMLRMHHIAGDAASMAVMYSELGPLYEADRSGRPHGLPDPPIQFGDFAVWQRERLQGPFLSELMQYWVGRLEAAPPLLALPTDRPRREVQRHDGAHRHFSLPDTISAGIDSLAREERATMYMVTLAAFVTFLYRLSGQDDIVVGSPMANRTHAELTRLVGFVTNTVALRVRLDGNPSFREILRRTREVAVGAYTHQEMPFEQVVTALIRDPARYIARFGQEAYDTKLIDSFWFIYRMIGKLTQRLYVLRPA